MVQTVTAERELIAGVIRRGPDLQLGFRVKSAEIVKSQ